MLEIKNTVTKIKQKTIPGYIIYDLQKNKNKEILEEVRGGMENHFTYRGMRIRKIVGFSLETMQEVK